MAYRIRDWEKHFEHADTRKALYRMSWVKLPTKQEGDGYCTLVDHPQGFAHFGVWTAILQLAAKSRVRGALVRDFPAGLRGHDATSIARITGAPVALVEEALPRLLEIGWLEEVAIEAVVLPKKSEEIPRESERVPGDRPAKYTLEREGEVQEEGEEDPSSPTVETLATKATTSAAILSRRVESVDCRAARVAIQRGDLVGLVRAFGCNASGERAAEWRRDCGGRQFMVVAAILARAIQDDAPIREPSGFRAALAAWDALPKPSRVESVNGACLALDMVSVN